MFGETLETDPALGECNKCVSTGLNVTNPHFGWAAKANPTHVAECCLSSSSKRILGLRKFDWPSFSFSKTFHLLSKRLFPFYINCWELLLLRVYCPSRTKVCLWVSCCKKFWGCKKTNHCRCYKLSSQIHILTYFYVPWMTGQCLSAGLVQALS